MRLLLSSALLSLVWFVIASAAASLAAWAIGRAVLRRTTPVGAIWLFAVRLLPAAASTVAAFAVFLPVHVRFEPADSDERFGVVLGVTAAAGLVLMAAAAWRAARAGLDGRRVASLVARAGTRTGNGSVDVGGMPGVSLSGIWRPTILVGADARAALTPAELDLAISHEIAHRQSLDNLKRFLMHVAPDAFRWTSVARQIEERWQAEAECEADASAVAGDGLRAVLLASALVKVARLAGHLRAPSPAWSAFHVPTLLERRVRQLVSGSLGPPASSRKLLWAGAGLFLGLPLGVWMFEISHALHTVTELMVAHLP
jgi:beta-lactamase regulating signal transducer with metallopeptidase domain